MGAAGRWRAAGARLLDEGGRALAAAGRGSSLAPFGALVLLGAGLAAHANTEPAIATTDGWPTPVRPRYGFTDEYIVTFCLLVSYSR